jgi:alginate O-acetyltransferase complex protein AlgI
MVVVIIAWAIFRADTLGIACLYIKNMFGIGATGIIDSVVVDYLKSTGIILAVSCIGVTPLIKNLFAKLRKTKFHFTEGIWIVIIFTLSLLQVVSSTYNPFIYFNF